MDLASAVITWKVVRNQKCQESAYYSSCCIINPFEAIIYLKVGRENADVFSILGYLSPL